MEAPITMWISVVYAILQASRPRNRQSGLPKPKARPVCPEATFACRISVNSRTACGLRLSACHRSRTKWHRGEPRGAIRASVIADELRPVLAARGIPADKFVVYFAFAQKLDRLSRICEDKSLQMAAADLIDLYEAKTLDGDTVRAIAAALFGVDVTS
jgi:hypothetical protein